MLREQITTNGVFGSKMMWNYFDDALARLRALSGIPTAPDRQVLAARLPGLRYVWLRRRDVVRQGVSWWRAAATGQYAVTGDDRPAGAPAYDRQAIRDLVGLARRSDRSWEQWFGDQRIRPLEVAYEDMVDDLGGTVLRVLTFLHIERPTGLPPIVPRLRRQADEDTERIVTRFRLDEA
jgi:LPS sulfotransferase NodH